MKKAIPVILLVLLALFTIFPLLFLLIGSFMGNRELMEHFAPMLNQADGYVTWLLLPVVFVFLIGQDYLEQGIATSMLKE